MYLHCFMTFRCPSFRAGLSPHVHHNHSHREIKPRWSILHNKHRVTRVCFNQKPRLSLLQTSWCDWCSSETPVMWLKTFSRCMICLRSSTSFNESIPVHSGIHVNEGSLKHLKSSSIGFILFRLSIFSYVIKEEICTIVHFFYRVLIKCTLPFKICMIWFCINLIS